VAKGLAQMGVSLAVSTETNLTDDRHLHLPSRYKILAMEVTSHVGALTTLEMR